MYPADTVSPASQDTSMPDFLRVPASFSVVHNTHNTRATLLIADEHNLLQFPNATLADYDMHEALATTFAFSLNGIMLSRHYSLTPVVTIMAPEARFDALLSCFIPTDQDTLRHLINEARVEHSVHTLSGSSKSGRAGIKTMVALETFHGLNDAIRDVTSAKDYDPKTAFVALNTHARL